MWQRLIRREKPTGSTDVHVPPPFPAEIWLQIFENFQDDSRSLLALAKTCWFFNQICQPRLYDAVKLLWSPSQSRILRPHNPISLFERSLKTRPDLGTFVRSLNLLRVDHLPEYPRVLTKLGRLPNLETLRIQRFRIDADLCSPLHCHPRLSTVEFNYCKLHGSLALAYSDNLRESRISKLIISYPTYYYPDSAGLWHVLIPAKLRSLELTEDGLLWPSGDSMFLVMTGWGKTRCLETLIVNTLPTSIIQFLISSPQLRHLSITCVIEPDMLQSFSSFPADAMPLLEHYEGPLQLSKILLRNRPVHSVTLRFTVFPGDGYKYPIDIPVVLQLPLVPLTELGIWYPHTWDLTHLGQLMWLVPVTIHHFTCPFLDFWNSRGWLRALSRFTELHTIRSPRYWKHFEEEHIKEISQLCPSLRELDLMHKRWTMVGLNEWECISKK